MRTLRFALAACFALPVLACSGDDNTNNSHPSADASSDGTTGGDAGRDGAADAAGGDATADARSDAAGLDATGDAVSDASTDGNADASDAVMLTDPMIVGILEAANLGEIQEAYLAVGAPDGGDAGFDAGFDAGAARSMNPGVTGFASMMIADHSMSQATVAAFGIAPAPSPIQAQLMTAAQRDLAMLSPLTGAPFDRAYLTAQVAAHTTVANIIQYDLMPNAQDPRLQAYLPILLTTVLGHLQHATALLGDAGVGADGGDAGTGPDATLGDAAAGLDAGDAEASP